MNFHDLITLYRLAAKRLDSREAYQEFQRFQGRLLVTYLRQQGAEIHGQRVLDLGCGFGGYSLALRDNGARVTGIDLSPSSILDRSDLAAADAVALPLKDECFDLVICASLIEHVRQPEVLLREILRILRAGGRLYLSFPPFYTPIGGHQFSPFHLLGESLAMRIARKRNLYHDKAWIREQYPSEMDSYDRAWGAWGLYPLSIRKVEKLLRRLPFQVTDRSTRWLPLDFSGIPLLREFLTWHVQFMLRKPISESHP